MGNAAGPDEALLTLDISRGVVTGSNRAASELLGRTEAELDGQPWQAALGCDGDTSVLLQRALDAQRRTQLPPLLLCRGDDQRVVVGGLLLPRGEDTVRLLLWPLQANPELVQLCAELTPVDVVAVLGVDQSPTDGHRDAQQLAVLMAEVCRGLGDILRGGDRVGTPVNETVALVLRDLDPRAAADVCRAALSHLQRGLDRAGAAPGQVRLCIGLAGAGAGSGAQALLAANAALNQARAGNEAIRVAQAGDQLFAATRLLAAEGIFGGGHQPRPLLPDGAESQPQSSRRRAPPALAPIEKDIEGYVVDNMEGAVDQAIFLAGLDIPIAIVGPAGTGKLYIARIIHDEGGGEDGGLVVLDCRELRSRNAAARTVAKELSGPANRTLVFKSPHLLHADVQQRLARQVASRTLADSNPPRALPRSRLVALFPDTLERLLRRGELQPQLASVFAGYPINVPPIRDRKQAVLRWAHKILGQEGAARDRDMKGFTPDAVQAMLRYEWPGNISEMRRCIYDALERTEKDWLTPVDLGLFKGIDPDANGYVPESEVFLAAVQAQPEEREVYQGSSLEAVDLALGQAVHDLLEHQLSKPLGSWLEDELVLAALERYRRDLPAAARFLHTRPRNLARWLPKIQAREEERTASALWQKAGRLLRDWVRESPQPELSPLVQMQDKLLAHVSTQGSALSAAKCAAIMGVSTPTYLKRLRESGQA